MSLMIKICGLRDRAMVEDAVRAGANALGFVFAESVRRVSPLEAAEAARDVPDSVLRVAVMHHPADDEWQQVLHAFSPDVLQTDIGDFATLAVPGTIRRWPVLRETAINADDALPTEFLYEGAKSGAGETVDWSRAAGFAARSRLILAGGLSAGNVADAVAQVRPYGIDVSSGVESRPGEKDIELIQQFIGAARTAEKDNGV